MHSKNTKENFRTAGAWTRQQYDDVNLDIGRIVGLTKKQKQALTLVLNTAYSAIWEREDAEPILDAIAIINPLAE